MLYIKCQTLWKQTKRKTLSYWSRFEPMKFLCFGTECDLVVDFSRVSVQSRLRYLQSLCFNYLQIPSENDWCHTQSLRLKKRNWNLPLWCEVLYSKILIPKKNIIINGYNVRMEKSFCKPPENQEKETYIINQCYTSKTYKQNIVSMLCIGREK